MREVIVDAAFHAKHPWFRRWLREVPDIPPPGWPDEREQQKYMPKERHMKRRNKMNASHRRQFRGLQRRLERQEQAMKLVQYRKLKWQSLAVMAEYKLRCGESAREVSGAAVGMGIVGVCGFVMGVALCLVAGW